MKWQLHVFNKKVEQQENDIIEVADEQQRTTEAVPAPLLYVHEMNWVCVVLAESSIRKGSWRRGRPVCVNPPLDMLPYLEIWMGGDPKWLYPVGGQPKAFTFVIGQWYQRFSYLFSGASSLHNIDPRRIRPEKFFWNFFKSQFEELGFIRLTTAGRVWNITSALFSFIPSGDEEEESTLIIVVGGDRKRHKDDGGGDQMTWYVSLLMSSINVKDTVIGLGPLNL